eukprot:Lankesteria_metandrocarpae@DN4801_c0_g1_i3.p1
MGHFIPPIRRFGIQLKAIGSPNLELRIQGIPHDSSYRRVFEWVFRRTRRNWMWPHRLRMLIVCLCPNHLHMYALNLEPLQILHTPLRCAVTGSPQFVKIRILSAFFQMFSRVKNVANTRGDLEGRSVCWVNTIKMLRCLPPPLPTNGKFNFTSKKMVCWALNTYSESGSVSCEKCDQHHCICGLIPYLGVTPGYTVVELTDCKTRLNNTRSKLDDFDMDIWRKHAFGTDVCGQVVKTLRNQCNKSVGVEMVTNAWFVMYEMLMEPKLQLVNEAVLREEVKRSMPNLYEMQTAHLCEIPGAFICALNHYLQTMEIRGNDSLWSDIEWNWTAMSLNPFYEGNDLRSMFDDDIFYEKTVENWLQGVDNSGDIMKRSNIENFISRCPGTCMLVTADGSVDCQFDPNAQEETTSRLNFAQLVCAMGMLKHKGTFVLKMFTLFEHSSMSNLAIMAMHFERLYFVKPTMSRRGNAEVFVVGVAFRGVKPKLLNRLLELVENTDHSLAIVPEDWIRDSSIYKENELLRNVSVDSSKIRFMNSFLRAVEQRADEQRNHIEANIEDFILKFAPLRNEAKVTFATELLERLDVIPIPLSRFIDQCDLGGGVNNSMRQGSRIAPSNMKTGKDRTELFKKWAAFKLERTMIHQEHGGVKFVMSVSTKARTEQNTSISGIVESRMLRTAMRETPTLTKKDQSRGLWEKGLLQSISMKRRTSSVKQNSRVFGDGVGSQGFTFSEPFVHSCSPILIKHLKSEYSDTCFETGLLEPYRVEVSRFLKSDCLEELLVERHQLFASCNEGGSYGFLNPTDISDCFYLDGYVSGSEELDLASDRSALQEVIPSSAVVNLAVSFLGCVPSFADQCVSHYPTMEAV